MLHWYKKCVFPFFNGTESVTKTEKNDRLFSMILCNLLRMCHKLPRKSHSITHPYTSGMDSGVHAAWSSTAAVSRYLAECPLFLF